MEPTVLATRACTTCRTRKTGCDKKLPACGYCLKRSLTCKYEVNDDHSNIARRSISGLVPVSTSSPGSGVLRQIDSLLDPTQADGLSNEINVQVGRILQWVGLSLQEVSSRYFKTFHHLFPVVSPTLLHEIATESLNGPPPADVSTLVVAMCLVVLRSPREEGTHVTRISHNTFYTIAKTLFAQVQATVSSSARLIQTGLLLAAYEYACCRLEAAYISIGTVTRMSYIAGIDNNPKLRISKEHKKQSNVELIQECNLWWGVLILERLILTELVTENYQLASKYPSPGFPLPCDLEDANDITSRVVGGGAANGPTTSETLYDPLSNFGRQAQAVYFLDQIIGIICTEVNADAKYIKLHKLDAQIQSFLGTMIHKSSQKLQLHCGALATTIRSLFLLHRNILITASCSAMPVLEAQLRDSSTVALDIAAKMVVEAAHDHLKGAVDALPLCCAYNVRAAKEHFRQSRTRHGDDYWKTSKDSLDNLEQMFRQRWASGAQSL